MRILKTSVGLASLLAVLLAVGATVAPSTLATRPPAASSSADLESANIAEEIRHAEDVLAKLARERGNLDGVTVSIGQTPRGEQAVAYYTQGRIVISDAHQLSVDAILAHETWHIIDWRDNGRIDWGENLPPRDPGAASRINR